jgi:hypothetical protein
MAMLILSNMEFLKGAKNEFMDNWFVEFIVFLKL